MDARQRSHQLGFEDQSSQHDREEAATGWPGKRSLTQEMSGSAGSALPDGLQKSLGSSMGEDLSSVRVHVDSNAAAAAQGLNARAFTVGQSVYFGAGQYDPHSQGGQRLIAHEVAHTVQQRGAAGSPQLDSLDVTTPGDAHEVEAESFAQSFVSGGKQKISGVSKGVIARAVIQRDLLDGEPPASMNHKAAPVNPKEPSAGELTQHAADTIRRERGQGGTNGVVHAVKNMRAQATPKTKGPIESAINSELNDEEKGALEGKKPDAAKEANAHSGQGAKKDEHKDGAAKPKTEGGKEHGAKEGAAAAKEGAAAGGEHDAKEGGEHGGKEAADGHGKKDKNAKDGHGKEGEHGAKDGAHGAGGAHHGGGEHAGGEHGAGDAHAGAAHDAAAHVPAAEGRELIEAELSFHDRWKVYQGGAGQRAAHLAKTLFYADTPGSGLTKVMNSDLGQGMIGAGRQVGMGLAVKMIATRGPLARIPGLGNMIGGYFSADALFSNGGAGIKKLAGNVGHGIGGAFSAKNWKESPFLTFANLVEGIKAVCEIIGHVCNILSGLAYAFAAIAAIGGLLSFFFPPLAFLVPYIPVAINFGRACGGIATVCLAVAALLSPIIPIFQALHLIFSKDDPLALANEETLYHESAQTALANYGAARVNQAINQKMGGEAPKKVLGSKFIGGQVSQVKEGAETYRSATDGHLAPTPKNLSAGADNVRKGLGMEGKSAQQVSKDYFDPKAQAHQTHHNHEEAKDAKRDVKLEERALHQAENERGTAQQNVNRSQRAMDRDPTPRHERDLAKHEAKLETRNQAVEQAEHRTSHAEHNFERAEARTQIPRGFVADPGKTGLAGVGGESGDAFNLSQVHRNEVNHKAHEGHLDHVAGEVSGEHGGGQHGAAPPGGDHAAAAGAHAAPSGNEHGTPGSEHGGEGGEHAAVPRDAQGHVQLPSPPGTLQEIDQMDQQIEQLGHQKQELQHTATEAKQLQQETKQQASGLKQSAAGVKAKVQTEQQRGQQKQQQIQQQNTEMTTKQQQAQGKTSSGTQQAAGPLQGIASAARTVDGLLARIPSNRFFDVSSAKNSVHQFVVGMDTVMGSGAQQQGVAGQAQQGMGERTAKATEAQGKNQAANQTGHQVANEMTADAGVAQNASNEAGSVAQEGQSHAQQTEQQIQQLRQQRQQKWSALLQWAGQHRQLRESAGGHH